MSNNNLTRKEIEDKLGIKLEYQGSSFYSEDLDQTFSNSYLKSESEQALIDIEIEALKNGDVEKAELSHSLLKSGTRYGLVHYSNEQRKDLGQYQNDTMKKVIEDIDLLDENATTTQIEDMVKQAKMLISTVEKVDASDKDFEELQSTLKQKSEELQVKFLDKYMQQIENMDMENFSQEDVTEIFEKYDEICELCDGQNTKDGKKQLREVLQNKIEQKIQQLDEKLKGLKEHIELPENEEQIAALQTQIEELEETLIDFKARQDFKEKWKLQKSWDSYVYYNEEQGYSVSLSSGAEIEARYKRDYSKIHNHRELRLDEQGEDMQDIMSDIASYRNNSRGTNDYEFSKREASIARKTAYLEKKLAILREHKDIDGNAERISQIESELETMQDAWVVAQRGYNNIDNDIQYANEQITAIQQRVKQYEKELKDIQPFTRAYDQKIAQIERANGDIKYYQRNIDKLQQTKEEIQSGENPSFMGKHHRERFEREQDAKRQAEQEAKAKAEQEAKARAEQEAKEAQARAEQEAKAKAEQEAREAQARAEQEAKARAEQEAREAQARAEQEAKARAEQEAREAQARAEQEKIRQAEDARRLEADLEYTRNSAKVQYSSPVVDQYWSEIHSQGSKVYEQQQHEKIRPREESIRDEVGDEFSRENQQLQERNNQTIDLWLNRFSGWYGAIDRVTQNVKAKFVKMKSDIVKAISDKIKERTNNRQETTQDQEQDGR